MFFDIKNNNLITKAVLEENKYYLIGSLKAYATHIENWIDIEIKELKKYNKPTVEDLLETLKSGNENAFYISTDEIFTKIIIPLEEFLFCKINNGNNLLEYLEKKYNNILSFNKLKEKEINELKEELAQSNLLKKRKILNKIKQIEKTKEKKLLIGNELTNDLKIFNLDKEEEFVIHIPLNILEEILKLN